MAKRYELRKRIFGEGNSLDFPKIDDGNRVDFRKRGKTYASLSKEPDGAQVVTFFSTKNETLIKDGDQPLLVKEMLETAFDVTKMQPEQGVQYVDADKSFQNYSRFLAAMNLITFSKRKRDHIASDVNAMFNDAANYQQNLLEDSLSLLSKPDKYTGMTRSYHGFDLD